MAAKSLLIDADALVALAKEDDTNHRLALHVAATLKNAHIYASPFTIPEAATVISHRISQKEAIRFLTEVRKRSITIIPLTADLEEEADTIFISQTAKGTSWPDCLNIAIAKAVKIDLVFSFDHIYMKSGIKTAP